MRKVSLLLLLVNLCGCAEIMSYGEPSDQMKAWSAQQDEQIKQNSEYKLIYDHDDFKDQSSWVLRLEGFSQYSTDEPPTDFVADPPYSFSVQKMKEKGKDPYYWFEFYYHGEGWIFIESGQTAIFLIDGKKYTLSGEGSSAHREVMEGNTVEEIAYYSVDRSFLKKIAEAKKVRLKIIGSKDEPERTFASVHLKNVTRFLSETVASGKTQRHNP